MSTGKTMTIRISKKTKIALDLFSARQTLKSGRNLTNDETIVALIENTDPELMEQAGKLEREHEKEDS